MCAAVAVAAAAVEQQRVSFFVEEGFDYLVVRARPERRLEECFLGRERGREWWRVL